ncbi:MAG: glycerate-2-kinase family protein [Pyrinomonadaceae bacterium]
MPDARGVAAAVRMASLLQQTRATDLVLALLSGGGSALLTLPAPGLALEDVQSLTEELLRCGATINEINTLRKHCTQLGGGGLAQLAAPAQIETLIISDVVGSPLDVIASGPTVPDPTTFADAWQIIARFDLEKHLSSTVLRHLTRGLENRIPETPKSTAKVWERVHNSVLGSNLTAINAALAAARERGVEASILTTSLEGEARAVGRAMAEMARSAAGRNGSQAFDAAHRRRRNHCELARAWSRRTQPRACARSGRSA